MVAEREYEQVRLTHPSSAMVTVASLSAKLIAFIKTVEERDEQQKIVNAELRSMAEAVNEKGTQ